MILLDLSQVMISNLMVQLATTKVTFDENLVRHMVLNSIRSYRMKYGQKYGELVICCDDKDIWRKDVFPLYKANRKKSREESSHDWTNIFEIMAMLRQELLETFPYKNIKIDRAEADDVIASMCHRFGGFSTGYIPTNPDLPSRNVIPVEEILILSGDKDFVQLQKYSNVSQYSPIQKNDVRTDNPERYLRSHIMLGDRGDGVPNFMSDDDTFVANKRQRPISRKKVEEWSIMKPEDFCDDNMLRGYKRNEILVNLDLVPKYIQDATIEMYKNQVPAPRSEILNYFMKHRLKKLTESIGDF